MQEGRPNKGSLKKLKSLKSLKIEPDEVAGLAIFDTITLNTDRHAGNILIGQKGELIPIDHGCSFVASDNSGICRLSETMGGPHNVLLSLPSAHQPMSKTMLKKINNFDPEEFEKCLKRQRDVIQKTHRETDGTLSNNSIFMSRCSMEFVKIAAKIKPRLSPAAIQSALGGNAKELLRFSPIH